MAPEWLAGKTVACPACGFALQIVPPRSSNEAFREVRTRLDSDWRTYMRSLKTDVERLLEE